MTATEVVAHGRRPELDGVRGVAILLVLLGHGLAGPVGASGVTLFFGLSGYLITGILVRERERTGSIALRRFYTRRLTRLAPPLFFMVLVTAVLMYRDITWDALVGPLTWTGNYLQLVGLEVYPFEHTWSLAVEEQFYLVWPLVLLSLLLLRRPVVALGAALAVLMAWRFMLLMLGQFEYAYSAFETAATAILAGCLIELAGWRIKSNLLVLCAIASLVAVPGLLWFVHEDAWFWVAFLTTPCVGIILAGCRDCPWLKWRWLGFFGITSYSLYLWHEPPAFLLAGGPEFTPQGVALGAAIGLVAYYIVERPVMNWRSRRTTPLQDRRRTERVYAVGNQPTRRLTETQ